jgi:hypothetical protein
MIRFLLIALGVQRNIEHSDGTSISGAPHNEIHELVGVNVWGLIDGGAS